jgi:hypothetical protein
MKRNTTVEKTGNKLKNKILEIHHWQNGLWREIVVHNGRYCS